MSEDQSVLVRRTAQEPWTSPDVTSYSNEAHLQEVLVADPSRIPGVGDRAMAVAELSTSGGPIDVCVVTERGEITVVECKLASSSERRRMVIGQVIDYASAIWQDGPADFQTAWASRGGPDLAEELDSDAFQRMQQNIGDARISLCLAVDHIDGDLRRLVEYLNRVTNHHIAVTALQLAYARHGDVEILIPSTYGGELAATKARTSGKTKSWTRDSFLQALEAATQRPLAEELLRRTEELERANGRDAVWYGAQPGGGVYLQPHGAERGPIQLWATPDGHLLVYGTWNTWGDTKGHDGYAQLAQLLGQDHRKGARGVRADTLDLEELWSVMLACTAALNRDR